MEVGLRVTREVEVDDNVDRLDVNTTCEQVTAHKVTASALTEVVEDAVAVLLHHLCVDVEARRPELSDLPCQELHTVHAVAEDDRLVDLQLLEERVQAVQLLVLLHERVELRHSLQGQLVHQVCLVHRGSHVLVHERFHCRREGWFMWIFKTISKTQTAHTHNLHSQK